MLPRVQTLVDVECSGEKRTKLKTAYLQSVYRSENLYIFYTSPITKGLFKLSIVKRVGKYLY